MNTLNLGKIKIVKGIPKKLSSKDRVAIDTEFFGMNSKRLHRPHGTFASMAATSDGETVYIIQDESQISEFLSAIDEAVWIFHNAKFDITQLRRFAHIPQRTKLWDTMLIEQIMFSGYYDNFSLGACYRRWCKTYLDKSEREEFEDSTEMTSDMIKYAAGDVVSDYFVYKAQRESISEEDLAIWKGIELPFLWTILGMSGITLDVKAWTELAETNELKAKTISAKYNTELGSINLASPAQVLKELKRRKYKVTNTSESTLVYVYESFKDEFARDVLEFRTSSKLASTYGKKFIKDYVEPDGKIYSDIFQIGAETARTSSRNPNLQNQPNLKDYRNCYIAGKDRELIIADWSSQEPRIAAYLCGDEHLKNIFAEGLDLYEQVAKIAFNDDFSNLHTINYSEWKKKRKPYKALVLGIFYGMSAYGLAQRLEIEEDEAEEMISKFFKAFPGVVEYVHTQQQCGDYVTSIYGRKVWMNKYSNQWSRNALNAPIQSSAADAMKIAAYRFCREWSGPDFYDNTPLVLLVHDEIVIEVDKENVDKAKACLKEVMEQVANEMHVGIPGIADAFSGPSWGAKE